MKRISKIGSLLPKSKLYLKRYSPTILTFVGGIGVIATAVMAVKATPKAMKLLEEATDEKGEDLTKLEIIMVTGSIYIPVALIGLSTITCIFGANVLNKRQQASIMSAYILMENTYKDYKNKVKELLGNEVNDQIIDSIVKDKYKNSDIMVSDEKQLFYEEHYGGYFESTREDVLMAEYHFNRNFALRGYANLNEFYQFLGLPTSDFGEKVGWSFDVGGEFYGYSWIDFEHRLVKMEDGMECYIIDMVFQPTEDYLGYF